MPPPLLARPKPSTELVSHGAARDIGGSNNRGFDIDTAAAVACRVAADGAVGDGRRAEHGSRGRDAASVCVGRVVEDQGITERESLDRANRAAASHDVTAAEREPADDDGDINGTVTVVDVEYPVAVEGCRYVVGAVASVDRE